jgi:hypothetical protein
MQKLSDSVLPLDVVVAFLAPTLINLWMVMGLNGVPGALFVCLAPLWLVIIKNLLVLPCITDARYSSMTALAAMTTVFVLWLLVQLTRSVPDTVAWQSFVFLLTATLFAYAVFSSLGTAPPERIANSLYSGVGLYLVLNVSLHLLAVAAPPIGQTSVASDALMLSLMGINTPRVIFPLAMGLNNYAVMGGLGFVIAVAMLRSESGVLVRTWWVLVSAAAIASLLLVDSRGATLFAVVAAVFVLLAPRFLTRRAHWFVFLAPLASVGVIALLLAIANLGAFEPLQEIVYLFLRPEAGAQDLGSGRALVWAVTVEELLQLKPEHLVGFGSYGHVTSGISKYYAHLFPYLDRPYFATLHNAAFQYVIDSGYVGALLFFWLLYSIVRHAALTRASLSASTAGAGLFLALMGLTEAVPTLYFRDMFFVFLMLCFYATTTNSPKSHSAPGGRGIRLGSSYG